MIFIFYLLQHEKIARVVALAVWCLMMGGLEVWGVLAVLPIALYNGRSGLRRPLIRFLFYAAYPAHLLLLVWLRALRIVPPHFLN